MNIAITGAEGFLGQHVRFYLLPFEKNGDVVVSHISKETLADVDRLARELISIDVVIHLAGMNRGDDEILYATNVGITSVLVEACVKAQVCPHILFASSTHAGGTSAYGRSKQEAARVLETWGAREGALVTIVTLPHVFGPFCKPYYNSAVATLCHELVEGLVSEIQDGARVELIHAYDVARAFYEVIVGKQGGGVRLAGASMLLADVHTFLVHAYEQYQANVVPKLLSTIEQQLFGTLQVYAFEKLFPRFLDVKDDPRGPIFEIVRGNGSGQVFFSTTRPGKTRGEHYHTRKFERFCVVQGEGEIAIRKLFDIDSKRFRVSGTEPVVIDMPQFHAHNLTNVGGNDLLAVFWISEHYNPKDPDTYHEIV